MHVLVATAGALPPELAADFVKVLAGPEGRVTVMNVTQAPSGFTDELSTEAWRPFDAGQGAPPPFGSRGGIDEYVQERGAKMAAPIMAALESRRIQPAAVFVEGDDAAEAIAATAERIGAEAIVMGVTRRLFDESAWTSVSFEVTAASRLPVLLIPAPRGCPDEASAAGDTAICHTPLGQ